MKNYPVHRESTDKIDREITQKLKNRVASRRPSAYYEQPKRNPVF
ncbi:hypothetical protein [Microseira wollei]|nr:hypothetical protein [Microseira wollei]